MAVAPSATAAPATVTAAVSASSAVPGDAVTVSGKARPGDPLVLERLVAGRWTTVAPGRAGADGAYTIPVPTSWYFTHRLRVRDARAKATSRTVTVVVHPDYAPTGSRKAYAFLTRQHLRWNPCQTITWGVNATGGIKDQDRWLKAAVQQVSLATGIRFRFAGHTTARSFDKKLRSPASIRRMHILFDWQTAQENKILRGSVIGFAASRAAQLRGHQAQYVTADIALDSDEAMDPEDFLAPAEEIDDANGYKFQLVAMHELGHALGLDHVRDPHQLMYPSNTDFNGRLNAGDLAGLAKVGAGLGCLPRYPYPVRG